MAQRTVSIPQRNAFGRDAQLYEVLARLTAAVNMALTLPTAPSGEVTASGTIRLSNPVARITGPITVKTIAPVDFGVPIFLVAAVGDVRLGTGGNIGSSALITAGTAMCLIPEAATGLWWPVGGGSGGGGTALTVEESDGTPSVAGVSTIKFDGATVTDDSGGTVTVQIPSPSGSHGALSGRSDADSHPATAISYDNTTSGMTATEVQAAIDELQATVGAAPVLATEAFTATASQTAFVLANTPTTDGIVYVSRDGVVARLADWSLATATVTFGTGLAAGTEVQIAYWRTAPSGSSPKAEGFTSAAAQTDFTLAHGPTVTLVVAVNGIVQSSTAWSIVSTTTLRFVSGLAASDDVWISYLY